MMDGGESENWVIEFTEADIRTIATEFREIDFSKTGVLTETDLRGASGGGSVVRMLAFAIADYDKQRMLNFEKFALYRKLVARALSDQEGFFRLAFALNDLDGDGVMDAGGLISFVSGLGVICSTDGARSIIQHIGGASAAGLSFDEFYKGFALRLLETVI